MNDLPKGSCLSRHQFQLNCFRVQCRSMFLFSPPLVCCVLQRCFAMLDYTHALLSGVSYVSWSRQLPSHCCHLLALLHRLPAKVHTLMFTIDKPWKLLMDMSPAFSYLKCHVENPCIDILRVLSEHDIAPCCLLLA
jgi:hypothetical protein